MAQWFFKNAQRKPTSIAVAATITTATAFVERKKNVGRMNYFKSKNKRCAKLKSPRFIPKNTLHANEMNMSYLARSWGKNPVITHFRLSLYSQYNFNVKKTM